MSSEFTEMSTITARIRTRIERLVKDSIFELGRRINEYSPVGDARYWQSPPPSGYVGGHYRRNWQYGFNSEPVGELDGTTNDFVGRLQVELTHFSGVHYIYNNVPYAQRIENGWSRQAPGPHAVAGRAVQSFGAIVKRAAR